ncbi:MAG: hypothetical protein ABIH03_02975 [Pseudomonadota bacterium]
MGRVVDEKRAAALSYRVFRFRGRLDMDNTQVESGVGVRLEP